MKRTILLWLICIFATGFSLKAQYEVEFQQRAALMMNRINVNTYTQKCATLGDYGKFVHGKIIGAFTQGQSSSIYVWASNSVIINKDCDNFHFNFFGQPRMFYGFPNHEPIRISEKYYLTKNFTRNDAYNFLTGEGTENHVNMNKPAGYLFCQLALQKYPTEAASWNASSKMAQIKTWIMWYSKTLIEMGNGEFNSSVYYGYNAYPWFNLYDFAEDAEVKDAAKAVLDFFAMELSLTYMQGLNGGVDMRGNNTSPLGEGGAFLSYLWFGDNPCADDNTLLSTYFATNKKEYLNVVYAATSTYRPPIEAVRIAQNKVTVPGMYYNAHCDYSMTNPNYIKHTLYRDKKYNLACGYIPYGGWASGCYATVSWKLLARGNVNTAKGAQYISGIGMIKDASNGRYRSPYDQFVHHKNVLIQMTRFPSTHAAVKTAIQNIILNEWKPKWQTDFLLRFPGDSKPTNPGNPVAIQNMSSEVASSYIFVKQNSGLFATITTWNIFFAEMDSVYVAIRSIDDAVPTYASGTFTDAGTTNAICGFVLEVGNKEDYSSFAHYRSTLAGSSLDKSFIASDSLIYTASSGEVIRVKYNKSGKWTEPIYDWGYGPTTQQIFQTSPPFYQPTPGNPAGITAWPSGDGHGKIATWSINGNKLDVTTTWAVYNGPGIFQKNKQMILTAQGSTYSIDFNGSNPIFSRKTPELKLYSNDVSVSEYGTNSQYSMITANGSWTITADSWIQLNATSGSNNKYLKINALGNPNATSRTGTITITSGTLTQNILVYQAAGPLAPPVNITLSNSFVSESLANSNSIGLFTTTDIDAGDKFTYTLVSGESSIDNSNFTIDGDQLKLNAALDYETKSILNIRVRTTDKALFFYEKVFTINITNVNETPYDISVTETAIDENVLIGKTFASLSSKDHDLGESFTYTLVSGTGSTDNASFAIVGNQLKINISPDFETKSSYAIRIRSTDAGSLFFEKQFTITINNVNETPTNLSLSNTNVYENATLNSVVGDLSANDPDAGSTFVYSFNTNGGNADNASFVIAGTQLKTNTTFSIPIKNLYVVQLNVKDNGGLQFNKIFTINIVPIPNAAPTEITLSNLSILENNTNGASIGDLSSTDANVGDNFTYTLAAGGTDNANFSIVGKRLFFNAVADLESKNSYSIKIRSTDQGSLFFEKMFTISVQNQNEIPTNLALSATAQTENSPVGSAFATVSTTDPDAGDTYTYTLVTGTGDSDNASFAIAGNQLKNNVLFDFETKTSYSIRIRTTDAGGLFFEKPFSIGITNANEPPTDISVTSTTINENVLIGKTVATLSSSDPDADETYTYALATGGTDNESFLVVNNQLKILVSPDYETKNLYSINLRSTDSKGLTYDKPIILSVNNLQDSPVLEVKQDYMVITSNSTYSFGKMNLNDQDFNTIQIFNRGYESLNIKSITISGTDFSLLNAPAANTLINNGSYVEIKVKFTPTTSGAKTGLLTITTNDVTNSNFTLNLSGEGVIETVTKPVISLSDGFDILPNNSILNFGTVAPQGSSEKVIYLRNKGNAVLDNIVITLTGSEYSLLKSDISKLDSGSTMIINLKLKSQNLGDNLGMLKITSNATDYPVFQINLKAQTIAALGILNPMPDQRIEVGKNFSFSIPDSVIYNPVSAPLYYQTMLSNGSLLPNWITFDSQTKTYTGVAPELKTYAIKFNFSDGTTLVSDYFNLFCIKIKQLLPSDVAKNSDNSFTIPGSIILSLTGGNQIISDGSCDVKTTKGAYADFSTKLTDKGITLTPTKTSSLTYPLDLVINYTRLDGSSITFLYTLTAPTSVNKMELLENNFTIYPNPTSEILNIVSDFAVLTTVNVYDLLGKKLITEQYTSDKHLLNLGKLKSGIYVLEIEQNGLKSKQKFSKTE